MNINIPNHGRDLSPDNIHISVANTNVSRMTKVASEYSVDISGKDKDISKFGMEELKSFDDVRAKASVKDVSLEHNALAVMSNSMSGEDFANLTKDGFSPADMTPEETVTNLDKIKATLVRSGADIPGYTDDLSTEDIEKIAGSAGSALVIENALKENQLPVSKENVESIDEVIKLSTEVSLPTDDAKKYMINNELEPSVSNFYMANHSSSDANAGSKASYYKDATGYVGKNPTELNIEELRPQIEKIIEDSGLEVSEKTMTEAKWLLEKNLPLTKENLESLSDINSVSFPIDKEIVAKSSAAAIADGFDAKEASLTNTESIVTKAGKLVAKVSDELDKAAQKMMANDPVSARRLLEETRLQLTVEASISLLKKGIEIDTSDLQKLVEDLKQAEKEAYAPFLMEKPFDEAMTDSDAVAVKSYEDELTLKLDLFKQTTLALDDLRTAPAEVVTNTIPDTTLAANGIEPANTLGDLQKNANALKADYEKAGKSYETLMTAPRYDMGDSIKKAFRNVDDILEDMDMEVNRLNEKAVRILGYSGMEINETNIDKAIKAEVAVENLISNMTPAKVLKMIKDGENPLDTDIYELSEKVAAEKVDDDSRKYSEFLYKLEKSGDISESEKTAFIGMYRLFHKIEKSDGKLVGDVVKSDAKLTLSNLLSASRSDRQVGTDIKIDDSFGALEKLVTYGESITDQILSGFRGSELDSEYAKAQADEVKEMASKEAAVMSALENMDEPGTPANMAAMDAIMNSRGTLFKNLKNRLENDDDKNEYREAVAELQDSFTDEESVNEAYKSFAEKTENLIKNEAENADNYIDVKSLRLMNRQLAIVSDMAKQRTYEVPVEINGEMTSINLKVISDSENAGKVNVSFETEDTGRVSAEFTLKNGDVSGFIVTQNSYFEGVVKNNEEAYRSEFKEAGVNVSSMYYTSSRSVSFKGNYTEKVDLNTPETKQLYSVAKAIIKAVQK